MRLVEVLSPGETPAGSGWNRGHCQRFRPAGNDGFFSRFVLRVLKPLVKLSLSIQAEDGLPLTVRRLMGEVVVNPNLFSKNITPSQGVVAKRDDLVTDLIAKLFKFLDTARFFSGIFDFRTSFRGETSRLQSWVSIMNRRWLPCCRPARKNYPALQLGRRKRSRRVLLRLLIELEGGIVKELLKEGGEQEVKVVAQPALKRYALY